MKLRTEGLKGNDANLGMGRLVIVTAPNGSGKSTIAEAIRFGVLGYIPALGKRPVDTAALLRGRRMAVDWQIDDLHSLTRSLIAGEDGSYKTAASASWVKKARGVQPAVEILGLFGRDELDAAELRNLIARLESLRTENTMARAGKVRTTRPEALFGE